ncbi:hypothetical protein DFA_05971 [Cavenderia fasciculata]|uniref:Uncharacterized protein n=1 Tax=Cavenderia fasciculata TaxID=261658 RepID=F4PJR1_CACFS|nr:uncharacterized protein DFA_05971 [Cavenderia fasciculata]EGG23835.1 hypothetical protein DFA_05971 [Cavenderia fasciculata]|eukprot:XP_004361686.1 hypothetical protein DFA_05971 [Cavenderia fasciculata]
MSSAGRKFEQQYRKEHGAGAGGESHARHIVPAKILEAHPSVGNDHESNYRMGSRDQNMVDLKIDNMIEKRNYQTHGLSNDEYIRPDRVRSRIEQQVASIKTMADYSKRYVRDLYLAAQHYEMDLRIFNGLDFDRR